MTDAFFAASPEALQEYGRGLAAQLPSHALLVLIGDLGAGKTTLVKGLAEGLGVAPAAQVTSPTYTLIHEYRCGLQSLYHLDLYRVEPGPSMDTLGLDEIWLPPPPPLRKIVAIEWGEKVESLLPRPYFRIRIAFRDDARQITAETVTSSHRA